MKLWRKPLDADNMKIPHGEVVIIKDRCKGCGFCVEYCPKEVLALAAEFNRKGYHPPEVIKNGECVNCNLCEMICPDFAIFSLELPADLTAEEREELARQAQAV
jgi:2-oxoglutarate ferredoxin oxidoreductase subunit delta